MFRDTLTGTPQGRQALLSIQHYKEQKITNLEWIGHSFAGNKEEHN